MKTRRKSCQEYGISRRAIQGYEKYKLVHYTSKNKYGHLLYDEDMVNRIVFIQFLQKLGLSLKEISQFINGTENEIKDVLEMRIQYLEGKKMALDALIEKTNKYIKDMED